MKLPSKPKESRLSVLERVADAMVSGDLIGERSIEDFRNAPIKVVGVRGYFSSKNKRGVWDDAFFVETLDGDRAAFNGNVDPSSFRKGIANLVDNQIVWYRPGLHGLSRPNPYPAFRQASVCVVRRDGNTGNGTALGNGLFRDRSNRRFWINLHKGGRGTSSLGCQTVPVQQWTAFHALIHTFLDRYKVKEFPYILLPFNP